MPEFSSTNRFECHDWSKDTDQSNFTIEQDMKIEKILENINTTPIGKVLKRIASLPEIRKGKVLNVREQLCSGKYELNERLDIALDKVLEDLTT